jgi:hypothetical protein
VRVDDEPGGGLRLTPGKQHAMWFAIVAAFLLAASRTFEDRTLAFAASTTLVGFILLVGAAVAGSAARTASLVRRVRARGFVGTRPAEDGGSYRQAARRPVVLLDGAPLAGPLRVEARRDRPTSAPSAYKVYLIGAGELVIVDEVATAEQARALVRRVESALGQELTQPDVEREFHFDAQSPAGLWLTAGLTAAYLALAFALSHWLFADPQLVSRREPIAPLVLVPFGAIAYGAWSTVGAASARARLIAEFGLRR